MDGSQMHLYDSIVFCNRLKNNLGPAGAEGFQGEIELFAETVSINSSGDEKKRPAAPAVRQRLHTVIGCLGYLGF